MVAYVADTEIYYVNMTDQPYQLTLLQANNLFVNMYIRAVTKTKYKYKFSKIYKTYLRKEPL